MKNEDITTKLIYVPEIYFTKVFHSILAKKRIFKLYIREIMGLINKLRILGKL